MTYQPNIALVRHDDSTTVSVTFDERIDDPADAKWRAAMALSREAAADVADAEAAARQMERLTAAEVA